MAIQKNVATISFGLVGDGSSTTVNLDLERDPFLVSPGVGLVTGAELANWFAEHIRTNKPIGATNGSTNTHHNAFTVTLAYPVLSFSFASVVAATDDLTTTLLF